MENQPNIVDPPAWPLRALAESVGDIGVRKFPDMFRCEAADTGKPAITAKASAKALRLLKALAEDDLTLAQAADRLCMSLSTADQQIRAARRALGASTNAGAIYTAMQQGLIEV